MMLALVKGVPRVLTIKDFIEEYVKYRKNIVTKRSQFDLKRAKERLEIVLGYLIALKDIDDVVILIKKSKDVSVASQLLMKKFKFTIRQTKAVLEMRLQQLTSLEGTKLRDEEKKLKISIENIEKLLKSEKEILKIIEAEVLDIKNKYGDKRRTSIERSFGELSEQDLIEKKDVMIVMTNTGYIKRMDIKTYREQKRGGTGVIGTGLKEEDFVTNLLTCSTHDHLLFFTSRGRVYWLKANDVPDAARQSKGRSIVNLLNLRDEEIVNVREIKDFEMDYLMIATKLGMVKRLSLQDLSKPRKTGVRIMKLPADGSDSIINVRRVSEKDEVLLITKKGQAIRFNVTDVRAMGRASYGVRGARLGKGDEVVSIESLPSNSKATILIVTEKGYGKRSSIENYRKTVRGSKGVIGLKINNRTGNIIAALEVDGNDSIIITTTKGMVVRISTRELRVMGRATQGMRLLRLKEGDTIADIVKVPKSTEAIEEYDELEEHSKEAKDLMKKKLKEDREKEKEEKEKMTELLKKSSKEHIKDVQKLAKDVGEAVEDKRDEKAKKI